MHAVCRQPALHPTGAKLHGLSALLLAFLPPLQPAAHVQNLSSLLLLLLLLQLLQSLTPSAPLPLCPMHTDFTFMLLLSRQLTVKQLENDEESIRKGADVQRTTHFDVINTVYSL